MDKPFQNSLVRVVQAKDKKPEQELAVWVMNYGGQNLFYFRGAGVGVVLVGRECRRQRVAYPSFSPTTNTETPKILKGVRSRMSIILR